MASLIKKFRDFFASKPSTAIKLPQPEKEWTFLVYLAGDNNLEGAGIDDIDEMEQAGGSSDKINVVVQFDRIRGYDPSNANWTTTKRFYIMKGAKPSEIESVELQDIGETNTGDPKVLQDFLMWGVTNFPAKHYAIILWNHGAGWKDTDVYRLVTERVRSFKPSHRKMLGRESIINFRTDHVRRALFDTTILGSLTVVARGIAYDDSNRDFLDNLELENVLSKVHQKIKRNIDILGMDACLMAMIEVAYQNKGYVDYVVASEETEPFDGWPYELIIKRLHKKPQQTPEEFTKGIVQDYVKSYNNAPDATQSSTKTSVLGDLAKAVSDLGQSLRSNIDTYQNELRRVINEVISYYDWDYVDLKNFAELVKQYIPAEASKAETVMKLVDKSVVETGGTGAGLSIYLPYYNYSKLYDGLNWAKATKWDEFIKEVLKRNLGSEKRVKYDKMIREGKPLAQ
ncbi:MAG: clostripain-related cysteine peptidase [Candidatus Hermodarchaeota archaeon]